MTFTGCTMSKLQVKLPMTDGKIYNLIKTKDVLEPQEQLISFEKNLTDIPSPKRISQCR